MLAAIGLVGFGRAPEPPTVERTTYVIVRHAEKVGDGSRDPALTAEGHARARRLAEMLLSMDIAGVYATPYERTQHTGGPVAEAFGLEVGSYDPRTGAAALEQLGERHAGRTIVVVGHSNTVPDLVRALGADPGVEQIDESEYDRLYLVTTIEDQQPVCHLIRF